MFPFCLFELYSSLVPEFSFLPVFVHSFPYPGSVCPPLLTLCQIVILVPRSSVPATVCHVVFIVNHVLPIHPMVCIWCPNLILDGIFGSFLSVLLVLGCWSLTDCLLVWLLHCWSSFLCCSCKATTPQYQFKWPRTLLNITQLQPCILSFILPNICNPYIIPEAESCENRTVVFGRRPRRDTDRLERQSWENFHGEKCPRGRGSEWRGSLSRLLTSSPKHATWLF